jgi:hypothetical protein
VIYALLNQAQPNADRLAIAQAIANRDAVAIRPWVTAGVIVHVMHAPAGTSYFCIHCRDHVFPTDQRPPRGLTAAGPWHFQHETEPDCVGQTRQPPLPHALGIENPANHGCYVCLGCETTPDRNRRDCQTIVAGRTYCHLATAMTPPCV